MKKFSIEEIELFVQVQKETISRADQLTDYFGDDEVTDTVSSMTFTTSITRTLR